MSHKFTIEYDMYTGLFDNGSYKCLGVFDSLEEAERAFPDCLDKVHGYYMNLPYNKKKRASYLIATYCWKTDEDGEITDEDAWNELSESEKEWLNNLSHAFEQ